MTDLTWAEYGNAPCTPLKNARKHRRIEGALGFVIAWANSITKDHEQPFITHFALCGAPSSLLDTAPAATFASLDIALCAADLGDGDGEKLTGVGGVGDADDPMGSNLEDDDSHC